jgi:hypothetical protein
MSEGEKTLYRRTARGFEPANDYADEWARSVKIGQVVELKGVKTRNAVFNALWWVLLGDIGKHCNPPMSKKQLDHMAKVGTGTGEWVKAIATKGPQKGQLVPVFVPGSISFAAMDEIEFKRFTREAATFLCESFLPGVAPDEFIRELEPLAMER